MFVVEPEERGQAMGSRRSVYGFLRSQLGQQGLPSTLHMVGSPRMLLVVGATSHDRHDKRVVRGSRQCMILCMVVPLLWLADVAV